MQSHKGYISKLLIYMYICYIILTFIDFSSLKLLFPIIRILYGESIIIFIISNFIILLFNNFMNKSFVSISIILIGIISLCLSLIFDKRIVVIVLFGLYLFILNSNLIKFQDFIKYDFFTRIFSFGFILLLYFTGLTGNFTGGSNIINVHSLGRYSLGFTGPNALADYFLSIMFSALLLFYSSKYRYKYKYKLLVVSLLIMGYIIFYYLSLSKGFLVSGFFLILFIVLGCFSSKISSLTSKFTVLIILISVSFSFLIISHANIINSHYDYLNLLLSDRIKYINSVFQLCPIKLFGYVNTDIINGKISSSIPLDNTYLSIIFECGIVGFIIFMLIFIIAGYLASNNRYYPLGPIIASLSICFIIEDHSRDIIMFLPIIATFILKNSINYRYNYN